MNTTSIPTIEPRLGAAPQPQELPAIAPADRFALAIGLRLILWGEHRAALRGERALRTEQARVGRAAGRVAADSDAAFERRTWAGPTW